MPLVISQFPNACPYLNPMVSRKMLYMGGNVRYRGCIMSGDWNDRMRMMFGSIAHRYDLMNTLMSFGMDRFWRRRVASLAGLPQNGIMLDVGAGTGRIALEACRAYGTARIIAVDLTVRMMKIGMKACPPRVSWACADALELPFRDSVFDAAVSGFLVRNVPDLRRSFEEQFRVVKPGGRVICLDAGPPPENALKPFMKIHLDAVIPRLGGLVTGDHAAYRYLPASTRSFKTAEELASLMESVGSVEVAFERHMFGAISIVSGRRPYRL